MTKIGIIGLGWLGKPLSKKLAQEGYCVKGTTTSLQKKNQLQREGHEVYKLTIQPESLVGDIFLFFENLDILIVNIPPQIQKEDTSSYIKKIDILIHHVVQFKIKQLLYVSTTSVFLDTDEISIYNETNNPNAYSSKANQLIEAERIIMNNVSFEATVVRFGGLVGNNRHPIYYLSGKQVGNAKAPVNLIHLEDCIKLLLCIINKNEWGHYFHGVTEIDKNKSEFYSFSALKRSLLPPVFTEIQSKGKKISSEFTRMHLGIQFNQDIS